MVNIIESDSFRSKHSKAIKKITRNTSVNWFRLFFNVNKYSIFWSWFWWPACFVFSSSSKYFPQNK